MHRNPKVKYCGLRTAEDIVVAVQCRVDYIGCIFYPPSQRYICPDDAAQSIIDAKQKLQKSIGDLQKYNMPAIVGVFVNSSIQEIIHAIKTVPLDVVQGYDMTLSAQDIGSRYWKGERVKARHQLYQLDIGEADAVVIDSFKEQEYGGTGTSFDWIWLHDTTMAYPYFIAGGITIDNVQKLLAYHPYGIDISSGIESSKGMKDHDLMYCMREKIDSYYATM